MSGKRSAEDAMYTLLAPPNLGLGLKLGSKYSKASLLARCQGDQAKIQQLEKALADTTVFKQVLKEQKAKPSKRPAALMKAKKMPMKKSMKANGKVVKKKLKKLSKVELAEKLKRRRKENSVIARPGDWKRKGHAYRLVFNGEKQRTTSGLKKKDLMKNKQGRIVSKKRHNWGKKMFKANRLENWTAALMAYRQERGITGFVKVKKEGPTTKPQEAELYKGCFEKWVTNKVQEYQNSLKKMGSKVQISVGVYPWKK